ncbi:MAG: GNAT family N-acetyltransferase [Pseudomonadota bacterium]
MTDLRKLAEADVKPLAQLWHDGWMEAHLAHVPAELTAQRTLDSFAKRLIAYGDLIRVAGPLGDPLGFCVVRGDELDQLFVEPVARGTSVARDLLADGEARMRSTGVERAHLLCVIENVRAARFYARQGWTDMGVINGTVAGANGGFSFPLLRFEKTLVS